VSDLLEQTLDSFDYSKRKQALHSLIDEIKAGRIEFPKPGIAINLHCHTFFSYNCYGYSPTKFAYLARKSALAVAGIVDFDVLDGLDEFLDASSLLNLKAVVGIESRVFVPEFADKVMSSPGEPGITYHMGIGFTSSELDPAANQFLKNLKETAQKRNKSLMHRVNTHLDPVHLDYDTDVLPLTPADNPTERHICLAFARKARSHFPNDSELAAYWSEKLSQKITIDDLPESVPLLNTIRTKTMKRGGVGYVSPDAGAFPKMAEMNSFTLQAGAIPTLTWLDGTSDGEQQIEELLDIAMSTGVSAVNIVPDRNFTPGRKDEKLKNLYHFVKIADERDLPIVVGTEMNSPGQKFVDSFDTDELSPLLPSFLKGAHIIYAHSVLQKSCKLGYTSNWANRHFDSVSEKNHFYRTIGSTLDPEHENLLTAFSEDAEPEQILKAVETQ
jgi:hypothetical protein